MVQSRAASVDDFMSEVSPERRPALDRLKGIDCGKGCIRWRKPEAMDFDPIADILSDIRDRGPGGCR